jgi:hypothetical protein
VCARCVGVIVFRGFPLRPSASLLSLPPMAEEEEVVVVWSGEGIGEANELPYI